MRALIALTIAITAAPLAHSESANDVRTFFDDFVRRTNAFDAGVADVYGLDAKIITLRDGSERQEMTGSQWRELLVKVMPIAKRLGDTSTFSDVQVTEFGDRFRVKAIRTSKLKCTTDTNYYLDVVNNNHNWQIVEEYTETASLSKCEPSKELAESLTKMRNGLLPYLPIDLDADTRLESVDVHGTSLVYGQRLHTIAAAEMDLAKLVALLRQIGVQNACGRGEMKALIDEGATVSYSYVDKDSQPITQVNISPGICP